MFNLRNVFIITGVLIGYNAATHCFVVRPYIAQNKATGEYYIVRFMPLGERDPRAKSSQREFSKNNVQLDTKNNNAGIKGGDVCVYGEFEKNGRTVGMVACKSGQLVDDVIKVVGVRTSTPWMNYNNYVGRLKLLGGESKGMPFFSLGDTVFLKKTYSATRGK